MRRFSQRNSLVTLSDINITPLLDLAFVLLIIFVITTPLLEQGMSLKLAKGGEPDTKLEKKDIRTLEIDARGQYALEKRHMNLDAIAGELVREMGSNPNLVVFIRADKAGPAEFLLAAIDRCQRSGITRYSLRTEPVNSR